MKSNPCRQCNKCFVYKGRHLAGYNCQHECEKYQAHKAYLESKRQFITGKRIDSLEELLNQEWVMMMGTLRHIEVIKSMTLRTVIRFIKAGAFTKALRKEVSNE